MITTSIASNCDSNIMVTKLSQLSQIFGQLSQLVVIENCDSFGTNFCVVIIEDSILNNCDLFFDDDWVLSQTSQISEICPLNKLSKFVIFLNNFLCCLDQYQCQGRPEQARALVQ